MHWEFYKDYIAFIFNIINPAISFIYIKTNFKKAFSEKRVWKI